MIFWGYMIFATLNVYLIYYFMDNPPHFLVHIIMFIYCMTKAFKTSKEDGTSI